MRQRLSQLRVIRVISALQLWVTVRCAVTRTPHSASLPCNQDTTQQCCEQHCHYLEAGCHHAYCSHKAGTPHLNELFASCAGQKGSMLIKPLNEPNTACPNHQPHSTSAPDHVKGRHPLPQIQHAANNINPKCCRRLSDKSSFSISMQHGRIAHSCILLARV